MRMWLRDMFTWVNPLNWLAETTHQEFRRRIEALEASVQSAHERLNDSNNALNEHMATPLLNGSHMELNPPGEYHPGEQIPGDGNS